MAQFVAPQPAYSRGTRCGGHAISVIFVGTFSVKHCSFGMELFK
jgi:hypothetical protein